MMQAVMMRLLGSYPNHIHCLLDSQIGTVLVVHFMTKMVADQEGPALELNQMMNQPVQFKLKIL